MQRRVRLRKLCGQGMVIGQDHLHAQALGQGNLLHSRHAAVHRDQQPAVLGQPAHGGLVQAIALVLAAGDIAARVRPQAAQRFQHDHAGAHAVAVVIAVHRNRRAAGDGRADHIARGAHIRHQKGIVQIALRRVQEGLRLFIGIRAAGNEQRGKQRRYARDFPLRAAADQLLHKTPFPK